VPVESSAAAGVGNELADAKAGLEDAKIVEAELVVVVQRGFADAADCELCQVLVQEKAGVVGQVHDLAVVGNAAADEADVAVEVAALLDDGFVDPDGMQAAAAALEEHVEADLA